MHKKLKLCFIGFGNVAQKFSHLLLEKKEWLEKNYGFEIAVTGIAGRSKGYAVDPDGLDLAALLEQAESTGRFDPRRKYYFTGTAEDVLDASQADVMVEMSTLSIEDGMPAAEYIRYAFQTGKHVL